MIKNQRIKSWFYSQKEDGNAEIARIRDVEYAHLRLENGDDLYLTKHGLPYVDILRPEHFLTDRDWFRANSERLPGTSSIYKIRTKRVNGRHKDIVLKWNRMGQDVPGAEESDDLLLAEFNSPFEEFSLVMELRHAMYNLLGAIRVQKPLAIYIPIESIELWQTGRKKHRMQRKISSHKDILLHMLRTYAVIYEWIPGIDAAKALEQGLVDDRFVESLYLDVGGKMRQRGFVVWDHKPHHLIIRPPKAGAAAGAASHGQPCGLVDFELLQRTTKHEEEVRVTRRREYLVRQRDRFTVKAPGVFHPHLHRVNHFGVDYIYGHVESTKGRLWVVGRDPYLFDFFLPERWRKSPKTKISLYGHMFHTITKDDIHLAWKVSNVGLQPDMDPFRNDELRALEHGYNSPFEEVALAIDLTNKGFQTIYPRAIYMSGRKTRISQNLSDRSRYITHAEEVTPDNMAVLQENHEYLIIWGYWNGPDEKLAEQDREYCHGLEALEAFRKGIISRDKYLSLLQVMRDRLSAVGIEDLNLRGDHILISLDTEGNIITDGQGMPELRICNFEFLRRLE